MYVYLHFNLLITITMISIIKNFSNGPKYARDLMF
jgi:hypothetical protein